MSWHHWSTFAVCTAAAALHRVPSAVTSTSAGSAAGATATGATWPSPSSATSMTMLPPRW